MIPALLLSPLQSCGQASKPQFGPSELVGSWLMMSEGVEHPAHCASFRPIRYHSDGTLSLVAERGTWRLTGEVLSETMTEHDAPMENEEDEDKVELGKPYVSSLQWNGRDRFLKRYSDGEIHEFIRCPTDES